MARWAAKGGAVGTAVALVVAGVLAQRGDPAPVVAALALAFVPYALLLRAPIDRDPRRALAIATALAALAGVVLVAAPPILSDDVYRYLWDARVLRHGIDPYAYAPDDPALAPLRDALHARINHPDLPTIYPPLAQLAFLLADLVAHAPWSPKLLALAAHLATGPVVARLAPARAATLAPLYALNPLALEEAALGGHVDALAALLLALAVLALARRAPLRAALAIAGAAATKLIGLALVPLLAAARDRRALAIGIALGASLVALAPVGGAGHGDGRSGPRGSGLGAYARTWRGNEGGFAILAAGAELALEGIGRAIGSPPGWLRVPEAAPLVRALDRTALDLHPPRGARKAVQRPTSLSTRHLGELAARGLAAAIVLGIAIAHARRRTRPVRAARDVVLAVLLCAPQVHPWYLVWVLPLELASGGFAALAWSAAILVAYAPLPGWLAVRVWDESVVARAIEYAIVGVALVLERRALARSVTDPRSRPRVAVIYTAPR